MHMSDDSDTEIESQIDDTEQDGPVLDGLSLLQSLQQGHANDAVTEELVQDAIAGLQSLSEHPDDAVDHGQIFDWASALVCALENGAGNWTKWDVLGQALAPSFLRALFEVRRRFRPTIYGHSTEHIVNFADALLSRFCTFSGEQGSSYTTPDKPWKRLIEEERLRAACCLPADPAQLADCIRHDAVSPGTRRLALALLWGVHVLRPSLIEGNINDRKELSDPHQIARILEAYIDEKPTDSTASVPLLECFSYAYVLSLFACVTTPGQFRPSTHRNLMAFLKLVLIRPSPQIGDRHVVKPADILFHAGSFVSWAWVTWEATGEAGEVLEQLTETWIASCAETPFDKHHKAQLEAAPQNAAPILLNIFKRTPPSHTTQLEALLIAFLDVPSLMDSENIAKEILQLGAKLIATECERHVKELVVKLWCSETLDIVKAVLGHDDGERIVQDVTAEIQKAVTDASTVEPDMLKGIKPVIDFLCIVAHSKASPAVSMRNDPTFVQSLVQWACELDLCSEAPSSLQESVVLLVGLLCQVGPDKGNRAFAYGASDLHEMILDKGVEDVTMAATFAQYTICSARFWKLDQLACIEAWTYLSEALSLTLAGRYQGMEGELAQLAIPAFCAALETVLEVLKKGSVQHVLASEWTVWLVRELQGLAAGSDSNSDSEVKVAAIKSLLAKIKRALDPNPPTESAPRPAFAFRLAYGLLGGQMRLVCIPETP